MNGDELKEHRRRLRLTQTQLAERLGVHVITISKWERDIHPIPRAVALLVETFKGKAGRRGKRWKR